MKTSRIQQLFDFLESDPNDAFTLYSIAFEYQKEGKVDQAIHYYNVLKDKHPNYIGLYYHLGKAYEVSELLEKAAQIYEVGIKIAIDNEEIHALEELKRAEQQLKDELLY